jgi:dienelactone hydrolase
LDDHPRRSGAPGIGVEAPPEGDEAEPVEIGGMTTTERSGTPGERRRDRARAIGVSLALASAGACLVAASPAPATPGPSRVVVRTGRGDFDLMVYRPAGAPAPAPRAAAGQPAGGASRPLPVVLLISGEGGWASFVDRVAGMLSGEGCWVGGLDAKKYFAEPRDDRGALAADLRIFADALVRTAGRPAGSPLVLAGFSFGADVAPWVAADAGWGGRVRGLLMIAPDAIGSLQYRLLEMVGIDYRDHTFEVAAALRDAAGIPVLFVHGEDDGASAAPALAQGAHEPKRLSVVPGAGHHFSGRDDRLKETLRDGLAWLLRQAPRRRDDAGSRP